jgi:hypothetical protein
MIDPPEVPNTISIASAVYHLRKNTLNVTATSSYPDAQLHLDDFGPMSFSKLLKGNYYWTFDGNVPVVPGIVTVSGPEGSASAEVSLK